MESACLLEINWFKRFSSSPDPPPIDNTPLLKIETQELDPEKTNRNDFVVVSQDHWNILVSAFGGGPKILVEVVKQSFVATLNKTPERIRFKILPSDTSSSTTVSESFLVPFSPVYDRSSTYRRIMMDLGLSEDSRVAFWADAEKTRPLTFTTYSSLRSALGDSTTVYVEVHPGTDSEVSSSPFVTLQDMIAEEEPLSHTTYSTSSASEKERHTIDNSYNPVSDPTYAPEKHSFLASSAPRLEDYFNTRTHNEYFRADFAPSLSPSPSPSPFPSPSPSSSPFTLMSLQRPSSHSSDSPLSLHPTSNSSWPSSSPAPSPTFPSLSPSPTPSPQPVPYSIFPSTSPFSLVSTSSSSSSLFPPPSTSRSPHSPNSSKRRGVVGLQNLGNTCYFNSALQCIMHSLPLTSYFLSHQYLSEINTINPLGCEGRIALEYGNLVREVWENRSSCGVIVPARLKAIVGRFAHQFLGTQQHDAHELLTFLLDGLHEDLNRVLDKPYAPTVESEPGESDAVTAARAWKSHLSRNQSVIVDLFVGQLKSSVDCPTCQKKSITFDPFSVLSLPLPGDRTVPITVIFIPLPKEEKEKGHKNKRNQEHEDNQTHSPHPNTDMFCEDAEARNADSDNRGTSSSPSPGISISSSLPVEIVLDLPKFATISSALEQISQIVAVPSQCLICCEKASYLCPTSVSPFARISNTAFCSDRLLSESPHLDSCPPPTFLSTHTPLLSSSFYQPISHITDLNKEILSVRSRHLIVFEVEHNDNILHRPLQNLEAKTGPVPKQMPLEDAESVVSTSNSSTPSSPSSSQSSSLFPLKSCITPPSATSLPSDSSKPCLSPDSIPDSGTSLSISPELAEKLFDSSAKVQGKEQEFDAGKVTTSPSLIVSCHSALVTLNSQSSSSSSSHNQFSTSLPSSSTTQSAFTSTNFLFPFYLSVKPEHDTCSDLVRKCWDYVKRFISPSAYRKWITTYEREGVAIRETQDEVSIEDNLDRYCEHDEHIRKKIEEKKRKTEERKLQKEAIPCKSLKTDSFQSAKPFFSNEALFPMGASSSPPTHLFPDPPSFDSPPPSPDLESPPPSEDPQPVFQSLYITVPKKHRMERIRYLSRFYLPRVVKELGAEGVPAPETGPTALTSTSLISLFRREQKRALRETERSQDENPTEKDEDTATFFKDLGQWEKEETDKAEDMQSRGASPSPRQLAEDQKERPLSEEERWRLRKLLKKKWTTQRRLFLPKDKIPLHLQVQRSTGEQVLTDSLHPTSVSSSCAHPLPLTPYSFPFSFSGYPHLSPPKDRLSYLSSELDLLLKHFSSPLSSTSPPYASFSSPPSSLTPPYSQLPQQFPVQSSPFSHSTPSRSDLLLNQINDDLDALLHHRIDSLAPDDKEAKEGSSASRQTSPSSTAPVSAVLSCVDSLRTKLFEEWKECKRKWEEEFNLSSAHLPKSEPDSEIPEKRKQETLSTSQEQTTVTETQSEPSEAIDCQSDLDWFTPKAVPCPPSSTPSPSLEVPQSSGQEKKEDEEKAEPRKRMRLYVEPIFGPRDCFACNPTDSVAKKESSSPKSIPPPTVYTPFSMLPRLSSGQGSSQQQPQSIPWWKSDGKLFHRCDPLCFKQDTFHSTGAEQGHKETKEEISPSAPSSCHTPPLSSSPAPVPEKSLFDTFASQDQDRQWFDSLSCPPRGLLPFRVIVSRLQNKSAVREIKPTTLPLRKGLKKKASSEAAKPCTPSRFTSSLMFATSSSRIQPLGSTQASRSHLSSRVSDSHVSRSTITQDPNRINGDDDEAASTDEDDGDDQQNDRDKFPSCTFDLKTSADQAGEEIEEDSDDSFASEDDSDDIDESSDPLVNLERSITLVWIAPQVVDPHLPMTVFEHETKKKHKEEEEKKRSRIIGLQDCLNAFTTKEELTKDNMWYCSTCKEHKRAWKQLSIWRFPFILVIQLKRFSSSSSSAIASTFFSTREKLTIPVNYPVVGLDLSEYEECPRDVARQMLNDVEQRYSRFPHTRCENDLNKNDCLSERVQSDSCLQESDFKQEPSSPSSSPSDLHSSEPADCPPIYDLFAVSIHMGSTGGGHYIAYALSESSSSWYSFNDSYPNRLCASSLDAEGNLLQKYSSKQLGESQNTQNEHDGTSFLSSETVAKSESSSPQIKSSKNLTASDAPIQADTGDQGNARSVCEGESPWTIVATGSIGGSPRGDSTETSEQHLSSQSSKCLTAPLSPFAGTEEENRHLVTSGAYLLFYKRRGVPWGQKLIEEALQEGEWVERERDRIIAERQEHLTITKERDEQIQLETSS